MDKSTIANFVTDRVKAIEAGEFQAFCDRLLLKMYPDDFIPVRAGGNCGDMKNDGYCYVSRKFFQAHASRGQEINKIETKIKNDLTGCIEKQRDVNEFVYITNDMLVGKVQNFIDGLRPQFPDVKIETWGPTKIASLIMNFSIEDISYIIDRNLPGGQINVENDLSDLGIIGEIFDFILKKIKTLSVSEKNKSDVKADLRKLNEKIKINFEGVHQKMVKDIFTNNWNRKAIVELFIQPQMEIDETRIFALIDLIHHEYATLSGVQDFEAPIKDFTVFEKIGRTFLPPEKQKNPDYISNAKAIVLYFFEFCEIGTKTADESGKLSQRN
ncbi:MAG TPA: hypothetical protein VK469_21855, partial [Candidatus Kapabacteria bacterium]|nr:hypothetical protein [Candidatus Kapabacteria bacterium]